MGVSGRGIFFEEGWVLIVQGIRSEFKGCGV